MSFKRALWHSGLTYQQTCRTCNTTIRYTDYNLDFRPWYPDGFVYCGNCKTPLRHNEAYAINEDGTPLRPVPGANAGTPATPATGAGAPSTASAPEGSMSDAENPNIAFCNNCGKRYVVGESNFCSGCGKKLG